MTDLRVLCIVLKFIRSSVFELTRSSPPLSLSLFVFSCIEWLSPICASAQIYLLLQRVVVFNCCVDVLQMNENLAVTIHVVRAVVFIVVFGGGDGGGVDAVVAFWYCSRSYRDQTYDYILLCVGWNHFGNITRI